MGRLQDQVAVVTGVSSGIGDRIALALAREGAAIVVHHWGEREIAARIAEEIAAGGGRAHPVDADLSNPAEAGAVITAAADTYGRIDILVNNAGGARDGPVLQMSDEDWRAVVDRGLSGTFYCIRAALREFVRQRRGRVINVTSSAGPAGPVGQANYVAARAGLIGLTRSVAREVGSRGITVNAVAPGFIGEAGARHLTQIPLGRAGTPHEVAAAVVFLASEEAGYITGQVLYVDGGMVMY